MQEDYVVVPMAPLRQAIAARMTEAVQTIPHFRVAAEVDVELLLAARRDFNQPRTDRPVSVNDLLIKACALALLKVPEVNVQFVDGEIHQFRHADISLVVAVNGGLVTPIVRTADTKSLADISNEAHELAERGRVGKLKMREIQGGTFTISNLGGSNVDDFDAIINPPQCAILAVGTAKQRPWVRNGNLCITNVLRVVLSLDHRVIDGATGAAFLSALAGLLREPQQLIS